MKNEEYDVMNVQNMVSAIYGGALGVNYRNTVLNERDRLLEILNSKFFCKKTDISQLKGNFAEFWHAGTFNINAAQRGSKHRVIVKESHELGSVDITGVNFDKDFGLKYYQNAAATAKQQSKSVEEILREKYTQSKMNVSWEEFLESKGIPSDANLNNPIYMEQIRIVPRDQLEDIRDWLEKKIAKETVNRPEQVERYKETLQKLDDRLRDGKINSIPLSKDQAEELAEIAKEGGINAEILELTDAQIIRLQYVVANAAKVGLSAAVVSGAISFGLSIYKKYKDGKKISQFEAEDWKNVFGETFSSFAKAGVSATILSIVGSYCEAAVPAASALLMATMGIISLIPDYQSGKLSKEEFAIEAEIICINAAVVLLGSVVGQMAIPMPGLGALIGGIASSIAWQIVEYFWGDELRDVLKVINERICEFKEKMEHYLRDIWDEISDFFSNSAEYFELMRDKDFNEKLRTLYKEYNEEQQIKDKVTSAVVMHN